MHNRLHHLNDFIPPREYQKFPLTADMAEFLTHKARIKTWHRHWEQWREAAKPFEESLSNLISRLVET